MDRGSNPPPRKRKRAPSDAVINPLSHPPDTLRQFTLAGYPAEQPLPSRVHRGFPHRPISTQRRKRHPSSIASNPKDPAGSDADIDTATDACSAWLTTDAETTTGTDPETDNPSTTHSSRSRKNKKDTKNQPAPDAKTQAYASRLGALTAVLRRCLADNDKDGDLDDLARARRAFGLLARARVRGRPVDLRQGRLWEDGVAVLMREGEVPSRRRRRARTRAVRGGRLEEGEDEDGQGGRDEGEGEGEGVGEREGEEEGEEEEDERVVQAREGEMLARLKAYYTYLIQQYPYSKQHASAAATGVLEFQAALFSAELEAAYASHRRALARLRREEDDDNGWDDNDDDEDRLGGMDSDLGDVDEPMDYDRDPMEQEQTDTWGGARPASPSRDDEHLRGLSRGERRRRKKEDELRLAALARMADIAQRMDTVMETVPFSRDHELLRLRAMVALYVGDLYVPPAPRSTTEDRESRRARAGQRKAARGFLQRIKEGRGELKEHDEKLLQSLESDDEEDDEDERGSGLPMYSSMGA